ncbi:DUF3995 domain-containing protein [Paenibacillus methanolicus]|uniref:Uncharacterized protein DUF3995 n=1 Tax=Paenibacillus methanolicus TaxID=582686 RepID=A0A5S5C835_9BACL|nr:DUF3995 domain-containing protein [Paenibacillus methanolicus]TYP74642.1 uncharacterized protein DUF3995 [Paenibacillus methanolicus]
MINLLAWIVGFTLMLLSGIHLYWLAGGKKGMAAALPGTGSKPLFRPTMAATGAVAIALAAAGWFVFALGGVANRSMVPDFLFPFGGWALSAVFILRAVGDLRWVGIFKKHKGTSFARWDSALYTPLCVCLGIGLMWITLKA